MSVETLPTGADISDEEFIRLQALSPSGAKKLLKAPALYRWEKDHPKPSTETLDRGKVVHSIVLGKGDPIEVLDFDSWRSKAARDARDEANAAGRLPILADDYLEAQKIAAAVRAHPLAASLLRTGTPEQCWVWKSDGVTLKCRTDWVTRVAGQLVVVDLKTSRSADPSEFRRSVATFGYHVQDAMNRAAVEAATGEQCDFLFLVVEPTAPYLVSVVELDDVSKALGEQQAERARQLYKRCLTTGEWPGYPQTISTISLPAWAFDDDTEDMVV